MWYINFALETRIFYTMVGCVELWHFFFNTFIEYGVIEKSYMSKSQSVPINSCGHSYSFGYMCLSGKSWYLSNRTNNQSCTHYTSMYMVSEVAQLCLTLCDPVDCSLPASSLRGILQARILEWVAISFSRGSSRSRDIAEHKLFEAYVSNC